MTIVVGVDRTGAILAREQPRHLSIQPMAIAAGTFPATPPSRPERGFSFTRFKRAFLYLKYDKTHH